MKDVLDFGVTKSMTSNKHEWRRKIQKGDQK